MSLRVLHVSNDLTTAGNGIVNLAVDLASGQAAYGYSVAVASRGGGYEKLLNEAGVRHYQLDQRRRPVTIARALLSLHRIIGEFKPDVVHCHMMTGAILTRAVRVLNSYRIVCQIHNIHERSSSLMNVGDLVVVSSHAAALEMGDAGVARSRIRVVRAGFLGSLRLPSFDSYAPAELIQPAIVTVAGMFRRKGIETLIDAFESLAPTFPSAHLYLVGDGPDREDFERRARSGQAADRIHFEGYQKDPQRYMRSAQVFVLASFRESFGLVLVEARQARTAIVATDVGGIPDALDFGAAGQLVQPGDVGTLARTVSQLLSDSHTRAYWTTAAGSNLEDLRIGRMVERFDEVYREVLRKPCRGERNPSPHFISSEESGLR